MRINKLAALLISAVFLSMLVETSALAAPTPRDSYLRQSMEKYLEQAGWPLGGNKEDLGFLDQTEKYQPKGQESQGESVGSLTQGGVSPGGQGNTTSGLDAQAKDQRRQVPQNKKGGCCQQTNNSPMYYDYMGGPNGPGNMPNDGEALVEPSNKYPKVTATFTMTPHQEHVYNNLMSNFHSDGPQLPASVDAEIKTLSSIMGAQMKDSPQSAFSQAGASQQGCAQGVADAVADAFDPTWWAMLSLQMEPLINVANESSGVPCASLQPVKIHENAVWMVMQMYRGCYMHMALLLLLPGAVMTQTKGLVSFGVLGSTNDEDAVSPFTGIMRSVIAIFLIPASQLIVSYAIDVGNSMSYEVGKEVNPAIIFLWADEQVFRAPDENKSNQILPPQMFPVLGKLSEGSELLSGVESQSKATVMLQALANSLAESAAFGLVMLCAFQITMACYLFLLGPIAAAFYAWPSGIGSLYTRVFTTWIDGLINLCLWKFWWNVVLLCIDTRLSWLGAAFSIYDQWELLMFIAFLVILTYVPFNPFDFKPGEMVSQVMQKAESAVGEASKG